MDEENIHKPDLDQAQPDAEPDRMAQPVDAEQPPRLPFPVVGVGASAGGLEAFGELLEAMRPDAGIAFVFVLHLPPDADSHLADILGRRTTMPVSQVEDGMPVEPDRVYVIRPGHVLTVRDGRLHLGPRLGGPKAANRPVDDLFRSLAEEQRERAVCVVLSGMGSNGTAGAQAVKAVGGLCIAQDPESAPYPSMPRHLIDAGYADYIARPADLPDILLSYAGSPYATGGREADAAEALRREEQHLREILAILRTRTKQDFAGYKKPTVLRRVQRRMGLARITTLAEYAKLLRQTPGEVTALADDLLIHVTGFFRDPEAWEALRERVVAPLVAAREAGGPVRCWVTACSSGEEAYSLAMLLTEESERAGKRLDVKVFATDLAERSLSHARAGVYPGGIESEVSPDRLARFFTRDDEMYRVRQDLRDKVVFAPQNVLQDPPFSRLDIASCRNLLIYLEAEVQRRVLALLHFGLREGGCLFLGSSETVGGAEELFEPLDRKARIFRRVGPTRHGAIDFPLPRVISVGGPAGSPAPRPDGPRPPVAELTRQTLLAWYTPAAVTVDRDHHILHHHGDASPFLRQPPGEPTRDLLLLARDGVRAAVRAALHRAAAEGKPVTAPDGWIEAAPDRRVRVRVTASPVLAPGGAPAPADYFVVAFEEREEVAPPALPGGADADAEVRRLRGELQGTIEELQTSNEELKASHEEAMSVNEELQSANEELETSKEEHQSLNEELRTVNSQLRAKMEEHQAASSDLASLLASTDIAVLFLDREFRIRRFTPAVRDLLDLIPGDVGRPAAALARKFDDPDLDGDCRAVLERLAPVAREVAGGNGRHYLRRVLPYRTADDRIDGVVVTFVDITDRKRAEEALAEEKEYAESIVQTLHEPLLVLNPDLTVRGVNPAFYKHFRVNPRNTVGRRVYDLGNRQWDIPALRTLLEDVLPDSNVFNDYEVTHDFEGLGRRVMLVNGRRLDHVQLILLGIRDITERKQAEERQAFLLKLSDALRPLAGPAAVQDAAARALGERLGVSRAMYAEVEGGPGGERGTIRGRYLGPGAEALGAFPERYEYGDYGERAMALRRGGEPMVVADVTTDPAFSAPERAAWAAGGVRAAVTVPLVKGGRFVADFGVQSATAREWTAGEVALVTETAERTWAAAERARAEAALKASEEKYKALFESMDEAYAVVEVMRDEASGLWNDFLFLEVNPAFVKHTGMPDPVGRTATQLLGTPNPRWAEVYGRVAETGEPTRLEEREPALGRVFDLYLFRLGGPDSRRVAVLFTDITERKRAEGAVRASEERLRLALAAARMGIWTLDVATGVQMRDANLNALLGLDAADSTQPFDEFFAHIHPDDRGAVRAAFADSTRDGRPLRVEFRVVRPDGSVRWLRDQGDVFGGTAVGSGHMTGACADVTERRQAEEALKASEERVRLILESATDFAILTLDPDRTVTSWSSGATAAFGFVADEIVGQSGDALFTPEDRAAGAPEQEVEEASRSGRAADERWHARKDGTRFFASGAMHPLRAGGGFVKVLRDLTDRKRMEDELRDARDRLEERVAERTADLERTMDALEAEMGRRRTLAQRLSTAQEDERRRVSRDLHDNIGQLMAGLSMAFKAIENSGDLPTATAARVADAQQLMAGLGREVHALAVRLRPTSLDDIGLEPALSQLVAEWSTRSGVMADFHAAGLVRLPTEVETTIYRVVQEALTNVAKHAKATAVSVAVTKPDGQVSVVVEDDGAGFDPDASPKGRLGLLGMRERVELVGGTIEIESSPGSGTTVVVQIPTKGGGS